MIAVLPHSPYIGSLELVEVYEYLDGPKLFTCRNASGQKYLGLWVGATAKSESFWLVSMSEERFQMVRSGGLTLAIALSQPENEFIYKCTISFDSGATSTEILLAEQIDLRLLPDPDERLALPTETLPIRFSEFKIANKALGLRREILGLHLDFGKSYREEAPVKGLGEILVSTQEIIDSLGQVADGLPTARGAISPEILMATEARVIQAGGGSFALEISAAQSVNLFGQSLIGDAIDRLVALISLGNQVEELRTMLLEIKPRAVSKYKDLLTALVENEGNLRIERASPDASRNHVVALDTITAAAALRTAEQVTRELGEVIKSHGVFVGVELPRKSFTAVLGERTLRGKILVTALDKAAHVTINASYLLTIRETVEVSSSGEERLRYELETIEDLAPPRSVEPPVRRRIKSDE